MLFSEMHFVGTKSVYVLLCSQRGVVVEWLETLGYGAESRRKGVRSSPRFPHPSDDWKTLSVNPAVNGYLFE